MIRLKDILKESEEFAKLPTEVKKHFLEIISTYGNHRESITRKSDIRETAEVLGAIADAAQEYTLREGDDWFDRVTIKRNMNELKKLCESFQKESAIAKQQEERLEALYEDMGHVLSRYFEIAEVSEEVMKERLGIKETAPEGWEDTEQESINEGEWSKIMAGVKKGDQSGPWSLVVIDGITKKVKHQKDVKVRNAIPAYYEDLKKKFKGDFLSIEDKSGQQVYKGRLVGNVKETAPEGWEDTVKAMKKDKDIDNPFALAHWMKGKGYQSHK